MIPETENPLEVKSVCPGKPARHALANPGRYFTQSPHCWFSRGTAHICLWERFDILTVRVGDLTKYLNSGNNSRASFISAWICIDDTCNNIQIKINTSQYINFI